MVKVAVAVGVDAGVSTARSGGPINIQSTAAMTAMPTKRRMRVPQGNPRRGRLPALGDV
jgi:hypothetical protein